MNPAVQPVATEGSHETQTAHADMQLKAEVGAVQAEQAGASKSEDIHSTHGRQAISIEAVAAADVPHPGGHAALIATGVAQAQTEAGAAGKRPSKTARKSTAGATRKAPAVRVKKEASAEVERVKEEVDLKVEIKVKKEAKVKKEVKVKKEMKAKSGLRLQAGVGVIGKVLSRAEMNAALAGLKRAEPNREMKHASGKEPYRTFGIHVNEKPCVSAEEVHMVKACQKKYWEMLQKARRAEAARIAESNGKNGDGTSQSQRPDTKARAVMTAEGLCVNTHKTAGHVPGHPPSNRYFLRAEMGCLGIHFPPLGGIDYCTAQQLPPGCPPFAISIVNSGCYEDDDDKGEQLVYTGQGGCDLLGNKKQIRDQVMKYGNMALVGNIELGIPIRVIRKNKDNASEYGNIFIYDGLYDVVKYWSEKGVEGFNVFKYLMIRRPGQAELLSKSLAFGGTSAPKNHSIESRGKQVRVVSKDISNGLERIPVPAVNDVDDELPFPTVGGGSSPSGNGRIRYSKPGASLPLLRYVVDYESDDRVPEPAPRILPAQFNKYPHEFVKLLNKGHMPYVKNKNDVFVVDMPRAMVFECGPWTGCPDGRKCGYALSQQGLQWRLEVFKTRFKGWGVRSWDTIPVGSYITTFVGRVQRVEDCDDSQDDTFYFDLGKRTDYNWDNQLIEEGRDENQVPKYYVDGGEIGGVCRYINHSCDPNLYVQPVLCDHADVDLPKICLFAATNIPPFQELTYDYGPQYIQENLDGKCNCGAANCQAPAD
ncbi:g273 [Coccomyxa elongata]